MQFSLSGITHVLLFPMSIFNYYQASNMHEYYRMTIFIQINNHDQQNSSKINFCSAPHTKKKIYIYIVQSGCSLLFLWVKRGP